MELSRRAGEFFNQIAANITITDNRPEDIFAQINYIINSTLSESVIALRKMCGISDERYEIGNGILEGEVETTEKYTIFATIVHICIFENGKIAKYHRNI